jgi:hypothetical protein
MVGQKGLIGIVGLLDYSWSMYMRQYIGLFGIVGRLGLIGLLDYSQLEQNSRSVRSDWFTRL